MKGIVADADIQGHWIVLLSRLKGKMWGGIWTSLNLQVETLASLGLPDNATDATIWHLCQQRDLILVTNNRNARDPESLQATIRAHNTSDSLPVFTLSDADRLLTSKAYAEQVAEKLLEYLLRIDEVRGAGRLFLP